jgi:hypothetical protein
MATHETAHLDDALAAFDRVIDRSPELVGR